MNSKRGQLAAIILICLIVIIIISIIVLLSLINKKSNNPETTNEIKYIPLYIKSVNQNIKTNYVLEQVFNDSKITISEGILTDWTEVTVDSKGIYSLACWSDDYYFNRTDKKISNEELALNSSKLICYPEKIGKIKVFHTGELRDKLSKISLNISTDNNLKHLTICSSHTIGILSVNLLNNQIICDTGSWRNWTEINFTTKTPIFLENNTYVCSNSLDWKTQCSKVERNICYYKGMTILNKLKNKADVCWYIGKNLKNSSILIDFQIDILNLNSYDELEFYILDQDTRIINNQEELLYETNIDLGSQTFKYLIKNNE